ncbi:hypothetical protein ACH347_19115 [Saccharopolyspora sp. 5N102]|uniref:hypothetical protein n=1 Tax=Saccharopolyspora sp. 5N102 TaxID=3375155 RepID=UPI0037A50450
MKNEYRNRARDVHGNVVQVGVHYGDIVINGGSRPVSSPAELPLTGECDPFLAGVHRARPDRDGGALPPYVARDADEELRTRVGEAGENGGLVLVVGPSTVGKTRAALEAVQGVLPRHRILAPDPGSDLRRLPELMDRKTPQWVLWLDDLEGHLGGTGLSPELLDWLTRSRIPVVATMRSRFYRELRSGPRRGDLRRGEHLLGMRVLNSVQPVLLERAWSAGELARATAAGDDRLREARTRFGDFGVTEYLAAGPELLTAWREARIPTADAGHPRGHALVAAAVDLARTGLTSPVPRQLLDELHTGYLLDAALLRPESLAEAWEWAIEQRLGVASLLVPGDVEQTTWRAFDYLADAADANVADVPDAVWRGALDHASDDERWMIGRAAYDANRWDVAEFAWWPLAERGESRAMNNLGILLGNRGDHEAAAKWIDRAADAESDVAMFKVAMRLRRESPGRFSLVSAEYWLRRAAEAGHVPAMYELASVLDSGASMSKAFSMLSPGWAEERLAETEMWFRRAAEAGDARAVTGLAELLLDAGRLVEAETWFQRFADTGNPDGLYRLAVVAMRRGDSHAVESALRDAAGAGHARAGYELAGLLRRRGEFDEADRLATRAIRHETRAMSDSISAHIRNR